MSVNDTEIKWLKTSLIVHVLLVFALFVFGILPGVSCLSRPKETTIPIEFTVDTSSLKDIQEDEKVEERAPPPTEKDAVSVPEKKPRKKTEVKISKKIVRRDSAPKKKPTLSKKEIEKLLAMGAKESDHTSIPNDDQIGLMAIKNALFTAWIRPTAESKGASPAMVEIGIDKFGNIISRKLVAKSGSMVLDKSALDAALAVQRIQNLPLGFAKRFPSVIIEFELK